MEITVDTTENAIGTVTTGVNHDEDTNMMSGTRATPRRGAKGPIRFKKMIPGITTTRVAARAAKTVHHVEKVARVSG